MRYEKYSLNIPTKKVQTLVESLMKGTPLKYACDKAMIPMCIIYQYQKKYNEFLEQYNNDPESVDLNLLEPPTTKDDVLIYEKLNILTLTTIIKNARVEYMEQLQENLKADTGSSWSRWAWLLERSFRDVYGKDEPAQTDKEKVESIKVVYIEPKASEERLKQLTEQVKESINVK